MNPEPEMFPVSWHKPRVWDLAAEREACLAAGCPEGIPYPLLRPHYKRARENHGGKSLRKLKAEGGLRPLQLVAILDDHPTSWELATTDLAQVPRLIELATSYDVVRMEHAEVFRPVLTECGSCDVLPGEMHLLGCGVELCALCGYQAIGCSCVLRVNGIVDSEAEDAFEEEHPEGATEEMWDVFDRQASKLGGRLPWSGEYPGTAACRAFGFFCKRNPSGSPYYVRCEASDPAAQLDLNQLHARAMWDPKRRQFHCNGKYASP